MDIETALGRLRDGINIDINEGFDIARLCQDLLESDEAKGRDILIRALDKKQLMPDELQSVWQSLSLAAGLAPYVDHVGLLGDREHLIHEAHRSKYLHEVFLHSEQLKISSRLESGKPTILTAPTSFGKSLLIQELIKSRTYRRVVIVQPTLALLDETRRKLESLNIDNLVVSTRQTVEPEKQAVFLFTAERVIEYSAFGNVDFFIIDEFYKLSPEREDERATILNQALNKLLSFTSNCYFLGPNVGSITESLVSSLDAEWIDTDFRTVAVDYFPITEGAASTGGKARDALLFSLIAKLEGTTLIYLSSPERAEKYAKDFADWLSGSSSGEAQVFDEIRDWVEKNLHLEWSLPRCLSKSIAFHHGTMPRHLAVEVVRAFNDTDVNWLFATSTLIEGVNTSARNVVLFDAHKGDKIPLDYFDYKNIVGRSGRMTEHFVGRVYEFNPKPAQLDLEVVVPLFDLNKAPPELLVQVSEERLTDSDKKRLENYYTQDMALREIVRQNAGISVDGQIELYRRIYESRNPSIWQWHGWPKYEELENVISESWSAYKQKGRGLTARGLTYTTFNFGQTKRLHALIARDINSNYWIQKKPDLDERIQSVVRRYLQIQRNWFDFRLPRWFIAASRLQELALKRRGLRPGDYTYYAGVIEHGFVRSAWSVLVEYAVPPTAIGKLETKLGEVPDWDSVVRKLRRLGSAGMTKLGLSAYEVRKVLEAIK